MRIEIRRQHIPWAMAAARAALGPVLIAGAACFWNGFALAGVVVAALLSDIYDGVLARRWGSDTAGVRLFDSMADTIFYLCTAAALWIGQPQMWRSNRGLLWALLGLEAARFAFDFVKFGKPASYHSYLAKTWGLVMAIAVVGVFAFGRRNVLVPAALVLGILCDAEGLAMSLVLPAWRRDVKTLRAAWRVRMQIFDERIFDKRISNERILYERRAGERDRLVRGAIARGKSLAIGGCLYVAVSLMLALPAFAVEEGQVVYTGGSLSVPQGTIGSLDWISPAALVFKFKPSPPASTPGEIDIAYKDISGFEYRTEVAHHLGVLPAVAVSLVKRRERKHLFSIKFTDPAGVAQAVIFEVPKHDPPALLEILRARAPQSCQTQRVRCGEFRNGQWGAGLGGTAQANRPR
jgi:phosphatidylglycerophosphate synthase